MLIFKTHSILDSYADDIIVSIILMKWEKIKDRNVQIFLWCFSIQLDFIFNFVQNKSLAVTPEI